MYYYVSGTVAHVEPYLAVIDCGGVGYACRTTSYTLSQIKKGDKARLHTCLSVREDAMDLYGFATQEELKLFQQLISVSGVGPKAALGILSSSSPANLAMSIITGDEKSLTAAQTISASGENVAGPAMTIIPQNKLSEASAALAVLGYSQTEINVALKGVDIDGQPLEQVIRLALKNMVKG